MKEFSILFEDNEILLINKPYGTAVQGGKGITHSLDEDLSLQLGYKIHLVHRLDKETSGILIVAKNAKAANRWTKLIGEKEVQKEYTVICLGNPCINGKEAKKGKLKSTVEAHGKTQDALLYFEEEESVSVNVKNFISPEETLPETLTLSRLHITLGTGRMHQIRIQLAKALSPIAGDDQHGNFKLNKILRKLGIKKLQLASTKLTVPIDGKSRTFTIPLPEHMQKTVDTFF